MRTRHNAIPWPPISPPPPGHLSFLGILGRTSSLIRLPIPPPAAHHPQHETNTIRFKTHDVTRLSSMPCIRSAPARTSQHKSSISRRSAPDTSLCIKAVCSPTTAYPDVLCGLAVMNRQKEA